MGKQIWVSPSDKGWKVHKNGVSEEIGIITHKSEAISKAIEIAKKEGLELKIQNRDGKISESNSYGKDKFHPKL